MSWLIDKFEGMIDEVEIGRMVNELNLSPLDILAIAAAVFERRGKKQSRQKRKATVVDREEIDDEDDDYEAAMLKHERESSSVSNVSCSPLKKLKIHVNEIMCSDPIKKPILDMGPLPFLEQGKLQRGYASISESLSNQEKLMREKLLKKPVADPLLDNTKNGRRFKKRTTGIVFYDPEFKEERLRREKAVKNPILDDDTFSSLPKQAKNIITGPQNTLDIPIEVRNKIATMGGTDIKLVIEKPLFESDLRPGQGRLSIPIRQIRATDFLTEQEKAQLDTKQEDGIKKSEIKVELFDPKGKKWIPNLRKWDMKKNDSTANNPIYVLVSEWNNIVRDNKLKPSNVIQLWSFRVGSKLCLVLVKVGVQRNNNGGGNEGENSGTGVASTSQKQRHP